MTVQALKSKFENAIIETKKLDEIDCIIIKKENILEITKFLKEQMDFLFLMDLFGIDYLNYPQRNYTHRFEVVYNFYSLSRNERLVVKAAIYEENPSIDSITPFYKAANWYEREVYDMYGIVFNNHPDLRRILMYDEFKGHPLRKDYPLKKRQPRINLR